MSKDKGFVDRFLGVVVKVQNNLDLKAISDGFAALMP